MTKVFLLLFLQKKKTFLPLGCAIRAIACAIPRAIEWRSEWRGEWRSCADPGALK